MLKIETKTKASFDVEVKDYAKENEVSEDVARKTLESASKIVEKYNGDAKKIARANLGLQQLVAKKDEDIQEPWHHY